MKRLRVKRIARRLDAGGCPCDDELGESWCVAALDTVKILRLGGVRAI